MSSAFCRRSNCISILTKKINRRTGVRCINVHSNLTRHKAIENDAEKQLYKNIYSRIKACGPITVADYMKEVLTHPSKGYYMSKDVFGPQGDFVTSPEISHIFGEMISVWIVTEWHKITDQPIQLVELGPGRGTLSNNILSIFNHLKLSNKVSLHLVEISEKLSKIQAEKICVKYEEQTPEKNEKQKNAVTHYMKGVTKHGVNVFWYYSIKDIPQGFTVYLAHEFFDALPIHKFQRTKDGWCEIMVDIDPEQKDRERFRYVLVKRDTPGTHFYIDVDDKRTHLEVSPESLVIIDYISNVLYENGGLGLIIDYGHNGDDKDTFRAFRQHRQYDPLLNPGSADLTADVDFSMIRKTASKNDRIVCLGPVKQNEFLKQMGIDLRLEALMKNASENKKKIIQRGYNMIMDDDKMGACFKVISLFPSVLKEHLQKWPVSGFYNESK